MKNTPALSPDLLRITEGRHHDPFAALGRHPEGDTTLVRAFLPYARSATIADIDQPMVRIEGSDIFEWRGDASHLPHHYRLAWEDHQGQPHSCIDPYSFAPQLGDLDLHLFGEGKHWHAYRFLGSRLHQIDGIDGVLFAVWAPNAARVSVVGDFNHWDGRINPMRSRNGIWELFIPELQEGAVYKYEIRNRDSGEILLKTDPYGRWFEKRPHTATIIEGAITYPWQDADWLEYRARFDWQHQPISIYEMHPGSWRLEANGDMLNYRDLAHQLVDYVKDMGYTHIELMPITEHPFDLSWGYQATGYYAPTSRFGTPDDFRYFVDYCHQQHIGVLLDWVPAHFPKDAFALARFDGTPLYEHADPRKGEHLDWSTLIYNFSRYEVKNFLLSSAIYWLEEYHIDGLRVDAVASMLYLDYSREDWIPNQYGGNENLEAIAFLRELNQVVHQQVPGALTIAEESTSFPQVTSPTDRGGLGFDMKWNMGWMNDSLSYMEKDPIYRQHHHDKLTFSMLYAFSENFMLPFSHDEVVHGKSSMLYKMPGDEWRQFANLRLLYTYMFTHPGKKLLFMGNDFGQGPEWSSERPLDWYVLDYPNHQGVQDVVRDLNRIYRTSPALHIFEFDWKGFEWLNCGERKLSLLSYLRNGREPDEHLVVVLNFTPVPRKGYRIGVPSGQQYLEIFNSDSTYYNGSNIGNGPDPIDAIPGEWGGRSHSIEITVPPLAGIILKPIGNAP